MHWDVKDMVAVTGKTKVVGIIGYPIEHSLSPIMQNSAFAAAFLDYIYLPFAVPPEKLEAAVNGLRALGVSGFNVTIPHKTAIISLLDRLDESAEAAGAVNTVKMTGSSLVGYNTDGDGLIDALSSELDYIPGSEQILVIGAGGAARGGIAALCRAGAGKILICNRSLDNAYSIKSAMNSRYPGTEIDVATPEQLSEKQLQASSLLLNTTPLGMKGEEIEHINISFLPASAKVYDMVYSKSATPLVERALASFIPAVNGIGMLVAQGELAFKIWTGQNAPKGVMRGALDHICRS
jgi:shikimate dehydrogenase